MPDETGGFDLMRKAGPLPIWTWLMIAGAVAFLIMKFKGGSGGSSSGGNGTFSSTNTQSGNTPTGGQYSSSFTATGSGPSAGTLTYQAGPMPFQQGDVYVNYPSPGNTPTPSGQQPIYAPGVTEGFYYTLPRAMYPQEIAQHAYNLANYNGQPDVVSLAYDAVMIALANPGQSFQTNNDPIPAGTKLFIPGHPGNPSTQASTWDNFSPQDSQPYVPPAVQPLPQSTMSTNTVGA